MGDISQFATDNFEDNTSQNIVPKDLRNGFGVIEDAVDRVQSVASAALPNVIETDFSIIGRITSVLLWSGGIEYNYIANSYEINNTEKGLKFFLDTQSQLGLKPDSLHCSIDVFKSFKTTINVSDPNYPVSFVGLHIINDVLNNSEGTDLRATGFGFCTKYQDSNLNNNIYAFVSEDNNFQSANRDSADTGLLYARNVDITFEIVKNGSNLEFHINNNLVATIATTRLINNPFQFRPYIHFRNSGGGTKEYLIKYFRLELE